MKRSIIAVFIAAASFSSIANAAGAYGFEHADNASQLSQQVNHIGRFNSAGANAPASMAKQHAAPTASQETGYSKAMETNNTIGGRVTTASALASHSPVASQETGYSKAMETNNTVGGRVTTASSLAAPNNTMDQGVKNDPTGHAAPVASAPTAKSKAMETANIMGAKVTAATAPVDMGAITKGKMASATNPVGAAPNTMDQGVKTNPMGNPVSMKAVTSTPETGNTMNLAASSMKPETKVNVTDKAGKITQTTAGAIAKVNPTAQVAVNYASQFSFNQPKGGSNHDHASSTRGGQNGRGSDNAHSHAFGGHGYGHDNSRSEGFGGHSHFH